MQIRSLFGPKSFRSSAHAQNRLHTFIIVTYRDGRGYVADMSTLI